MSHYSSPNFALFSILGYITLRFSASIESEAFNVQLYTS